MNTKASITSKLIAPCGMNCGICIGYLRDKNPCPGCNYDDTNKPKYCISCIIKNCEFFQNGKSKFCFDCNRYPCRRLKQLDKRYRTKYGMSMVNNLNYIKKNGVRKFVEEEKIKWKCNECGSVLSVHRNFCLNCNTEYRVNTTIELTG